MRIVLVMLLIMNLALANSDKVALVIGNKDYTNQTGLHNPIRDAKLIRDTLENDLGFSVIEAYDADLSKLDKKLTEFINMAQNAKVAVVYYAGHGIGVGTKNYLIPLGATNLSIDNMASFTKPKSHRHFYPKENRQYSPLCKKCN